jgi:hypothetical protein
VSRMWNEMEPAEKQSPSPSSEPVGHSQNGSAEHRNSKRSPLQVSLLVYGSAVDNRPFREKTDTLNANEEGCLILLEASVARRQRLCLVNLSNQDERECRVVRLGKLLPGKRQVAVAFLRPAPEFWFDS